MIDLKAIQAYLPQRTQSELSAGTTVPIHEAYIWQLLTEVKKLREALGWYRDHCEDLGRKETHDELWEHDYSLAILERDSGVMANAVLKEKKDE